MTTGTVLARGVFPNPGNVLRPGQYAKVRAVVEVKKNALLVPQRAVQDVQGVRQVAVVGRGRHRGVRAVQVGAAYRVAVDHRAGLKPGERVMVEGLDKVRPAQKVKHRSPPRRAPRPAAAPSS